MSGSAIFEAKRVELHKLRYSIRVDDAEERKHDMAFRESEGWKEGVLRLRFGLLFTSLPDRDFGHGLSDGAALIYVAIFAW